MSVELREMINFHLTGRRASDADADWQLMDTVPALLAPYRELAELRYDYPLILIEGRDTEAIFDTLTGVVNRLLQTIAPRGNAGQQLRLHVLRLERRMRKLAATNSGVTLEQLWKLAEKSLLAECAKAEAESLQNSISAARFALRTEGRVVDCDARLPALLFEHAWHKLAARRHEYARKIYRLGIRLRDILKVDDLKDESSRTAQQLKLTLGKRYKDTFDFERMAELLDDSVPDNRLPQARKRRIRESLAVLESQRFFAAGSNDDHHEFVYDNLPAALKAYNEHMPQIADIVRAVAIAELELENNYCEEKHDSYFERFTAQALTPEDRAEFPGYLVCLNESACDNRDLARLMEIVTCDMPIKVLVQVADPLGEPSPVDGLPHAASFVQQLANSIVAGNAYVLQAPASNLYGQREQFRKGLEYRGPAIFSIFVPADDGDARLPAYLVAAAALESRTFPAFSYDPAAGEGLADRFDISQNPDVDEDWPRRELRYEDEDLQAVAEDVALTPVDFAAMDPRYHDHFAVAAREAWGDQLVDAASCMGPGGCPGVDSVPHVAVVDGDKLLQRLAVDDKLIRIAGRFLDRWHALQELGGAHSSYARSAPPQPAPPDDVPATNETDETAQAEPETVAEAPFEAGESSDEPYIETPRCTTCDECTNRNDRMFAYDDNKQAFISDPDAGTYRELVEAAEVCQVAIIHPGQPRNPDEPGLVELIERAAPFNDPS